ncbi:LacI family gluconate utilization system Gnt-I transcriptional repressor [Erwinia toletana]|uniref:LacI family gluconate utilization system Gnt-I transcriptional repressor n=1 Tax=Winslowiella toletana TaxID=92490 RepID=A0ABS4PAN2_9GAMM|nr:LacI family DNA-binding transcriptional regulator [Winslowiella toletana]MBP2169698.1 LacI family gluconate utilization system Gnt-I transcriptional repressor [Winslowiella toletana]
MAMKHSSQSGMTIADVARLAGVAPITVSRVLNQPAQVKPATLEKVRRVIEETGFVRNQIAGALASNRSRLVAVIVPMLTNPIFSDTFQAIAEKLAAADYQVLLGTSGYQAQHEQELLEVILSRRPDGIILTGTLHTEDSRKRLRATRVPVVETWDISPDPIDMLIGFSHEDTGRAIALHLLAKNYRHFALLSVDDPRGSLRAKSFIHTLNANGIHDVQQHYFSGLPTLQQGREGLSALLTSTPRPLMVVCTSDTIAHGVLTEAASRGIKVPQEIAVFGFGDMNFAAHTFPPLSTVKIDGKKIGQLAASALLDRLKGDDAAAIYRDIGFTIIDRDSTFNG